MYTRMRQALNMIAPHACNTRTHVGLFHRGLSNDLAKEEESDWMMYTSKLLCTVEGCMEQANSNQRAIVRPGIDANWHHCSHSGGSGFTTFGAHSSQHM